MKDIIKNLLPNFCLQYYHRLLSVYYSLKWMNEEIKLKKHTIIDLDIDKRDIEKRVFSQNGEDGVLSFIFDEIKPISKIFIEFGFGAVENNSLYLVISRGFKGLYVDGDKRNILLFRILSFLHSIKGVKSVNAFLTSANVENILKSYIKEKEIDLLSIDIDGNDYWIWDKISYYNPRVVVVEYNATFGFDKAITIPYDDAFDRHEKHKSGYYYGASIIAFLKLGEKKGYELVYCEKTGNNAFFIRKDLMTKALELLKSDLCYYPNSRRLELYTEQEQLDLIKGLETVAV